MPPTINLPILSTQDREGLQELLLDPVEYRKSGLSLNHIIGCPIDCAYCIRHIYANFDMKSPHSLMSDEDAVDYLLAHRFFQPHITPLQIFNKATDPFLPSVKPHTFRVLELLAKRGITNHVLVISRCQINETDAETLNSFLPLKLTFLLTRSGIRDKRIEPLGPTPASSSLKMAFLAARNYRVILYWRPIVPGLNDTDEDIRDAALLSHSAHATVFTGLFYREEIQKYYELNALPLPYISTARRKIFPEELEVRLIRAFRDSGGGPRFCPFHS